MILCRTSLVDCRTTSAVFQTTIALSSVILGCPVHVLVVPGVLVVLGEWTTKISNTGYNGQMEMDELAIGRSGNGRSGNRRVNNNI